MIYYITFSNGTFSFGGSDEHTESIVTTIENWSVGVGSYNPNDDLEDEKSFVRYTALSANESSGGFKFKLLDYSYPKIVFKAAWIKNDIYSKDTYEDALDFWLT